MDVKINKLIIEKDRPEHIAKHKVTVEEVLEVVSGNYIFIQAKLGRWNLIGKTKKGKMLSIIVGERNEKYTYGLVTARVASNKEKSFYREYTLQLGGGYE